MCVSDLRIQRVVATPLICLDEEVEHGDLTDTLHGAAAGGVVGTLEEWAKCCGYLSGAGEAEQDWR
jgi:hypothetical protein